MHEFDLTTAIEPVAPGRFTAHTSPRFWNAHGPFGGTTAATVVRALLHGADPGFGVAGLTLHYLDVIGAGRAEPWTGGPALANFTREFTYDVTHGAPHSNEPLAAGGRLTLCEPRPLDLPLLAAYADAWPPVLWAAQDRPTIFSTLSLQATFRVGPDELAAAPDTRPLLVDLHSTLARDGLVDEQQRIWDADGRLLVQTVQLCRYTSEAPRHEHLAGYRG